MGTSCTLRWRNEHDRELVWTVNPTHRSPRESRIRSSSKRTRCTGSSSNPRPDELVFVSSFTGGEVIRSGCTFRRGHGRIFYFSPADQDSPSTHNKDIRRVIANGVQWARTDRPERSHPVLLRYRHDDFFNGIDYSGPLR